MTRNGSLAYYLAGWICGSFFMALAFWLNVHWSRTFSSQGTLHDVSFLGFCFFGLILGAVPSFLFGWLLRRLVKLFRTEQLWIWMVEGAGLAFLLVRMLGGLAPFVQNPRFLPYSALPIWPFLILGPAVIVEGGLWITVPVGAATAGVLFAVHRAFAQKSES
jgi:hypothetical protein